MPGVPEATKSSLPNIHRIMNSSCPQDLTIVWRHFPLEALGRTQDSFAEVSGNFFHPD
jgi:hypothetical protein